MALNAAYGTDNATNKELKESLKDDIQRLSPNECYLYDNLADSTATQPTHSFLVDHLGRASATGAVAEGAETTYADLTAPVRYTNYVQNIEKPFKVSDVQIASNNAGYDDAYAYHKAREMIAWKQSAEYSFLKGTGTAPNSGVAAVMSGLTSVSTINFVSYASGTSITRTRLNDISELLYADVTSSPTTVLCSIKVKLGINGFTTPITRSIDAKDYVYTDRIDVIDSDFGRQTLVDHQDLATSDMTMYVMQPRGFKKAFLIEPNHQERAKTGASRSGVIFGSLTLEYNPRALVKASGIVG